MLKHYFRSLLLPAVALLTFLSARADVEINETNFPDAYFRDYVTNTLSYKDGSTTVYPGKDGKLTTAEIANITYINCSGRRIANLKGIEHFTALKELYCYSNRLTSLDVSKNTALTSLGCNNNQLAELDVRKNAALKSLSCYDNRLTKLDVSNNTELSYLYCWSNKLTKLDVSNNTALKELYCDYNELTELDVTNNKELTDLWCNDNHLVELDLSTNSALTSIYAANQNREISANAVRVNGTVGWLYYFAIDDERAGRLLKEVLGTDADGNPVETKWEHSKTTWALGPYINDDGSEDAGVAGVVTGTGQKAASFDDVNNGDLNKVYGTIVVLNPGSEDDTSASGTAMYSYDMGYTGTNSSVKTEAGAVNFTLNWTADLTDPKVITGIDALGAAIEAGEVMYYNLAGQCSDTPFEGVNIVVARRGDGTTATHKEMR